MYIMHRDGVPEGDKKRLYQHARLALHEMDAVNNLSYLGINVDKVRLTHSFLHASRS
jgi:syntaxin-binding protein 1